MEKVSFHNVYNTLSPVAMTMEQLLSPNRLWDPKNKQAGRNHDGAVCREGCAGAGRLRGGKKAMLMTKLCTQSVQFYGSLCGCFKN